MRILRSFETVVFVVLAGLAVGCSSEVKVGAIVSETGDISPYGKQVRRGLDLALEEINKAGGINGSPVRLIYRDDASDATKAGEQAQDLISNEGVRFVIGGVASPSALQAAAICQKHEVVFLSPTASAPTYSDAGDFVFRNFPSDVLEGTEMANFARGLGVKRVVIVALDNEFGEGLTEVFKSHFESKTREVVKTFKFKQDDTASLAEIAREIKQIEPHGVYIVAYVNGMVAMLRELKAAGVEAVLMGAGSVTEEVPRLAGDAAELLVYPQPSFDVDSTEPGVAGFVRAYRNKYNEDPDVYAAHGYDALNLLKQAMLDTGSTHPDDVRRGLYGLDGYEGAAGRTAFDARGDVIRYPRLFIVSEGRAIPYEEFEQLGGKLTVS